MPTCSQLTAVCIAPPSWDPLGLLVQYGTEIWYPFDSGNTKKDAYCCTKLNCNAQWKLDFRVALSELKKAIFVSIPHIRYLSKSPIHAWFWMLLYLRMLSICSVTDQGGHDHFAHVLSPSSSTFSLCCTALQSFFCFCPNQSCANICQKPEKMSKIKFSKENSSSSF